MQTEEKLELNDRLIIASDILNNLIEDMKLKANKSSEDRLRREYLIIALKTAETAMAVNSLQKSILTIEELVKTEE